jgi:methyl-accepting chemotaxis protein
MRLDDRFQAMEAQCRQADSLLEKDATEEEIRQLSVRGGLTPKYIVQWMDGKVKGGLPSLPAFDVWKDRPFYMDVIYENDEAFFLAACQSNKTLHATGLLYPQSAVISDLETILPAEFSIVLTSTDRRIVYHRDTSKIRKTIDSLNDVIFEKKADGLEVIYYSENHVRHMLIGPQQSAGLSLLLLTSREKMEEKIDRLLVYTAITMLLLTVVYAIVVYLLLFFTLGGLRGLTDQVIQLTSGDLQAQSGYITSDSLGRLSLHLKELTEKLRTIIMNIRFTTDMIYKLNQKNVEYTKKSHDQFQSISVNVEEISSTTEEISTSFDEINHRTQAHIQNIEEYLESIQRLTTATMQMNETVNQLSSLYTSTRSEASIGRSLLKELKEAMRSLDERANRIEGIVGFINDISKQVNLLALNASIEAARAGDAGRGFAVVADEVSRLADRISESVKNISSLVQGNREESKRSYENVTEAARLFNRVLVDMNMINDVIEEIGRLRSELSETNQYVAGQNQEINVIIKFIAQISKENKNSMYEIAVELESIMKLIQNHMNQEAELRDQAATLLNYGTEINEIMKFFKSSELDVESEERSKTETDAGFSAD